MISAYLQINFFLLYSFWWFHIRSIHLFMEKRFGDCERKPQTSVDMNQANLKLT
jgi:hypothetical protein